jgi:hypothetical protein
MYLAAAKKLNEGTIDSSKLRRVCALLERLEEDSHLHKIVARYCLAFHLLKIDRLAHAEVLVGAILHLSRLEVLAIDALGITDLISNVMSTLSRADSRNGGYFAALAAIDRSLYAVSLEETHPLGANHPHMLEMVVRKAVLCYKLRRLGEAEHFYWIALRGRVATLGPEHKSTNKAHHSLITVLKEQGRWESMKGRVQQVVVDPQVAVTEYESWWRRVVEANRGSTIIRASSEEMD